MTPLRDRSSGIRASRRRVDYNSSGEYQTSEHQNDPGLQELNDLGNDRRERITTSEIPRQRPQTIYTSSIRDSDKLGTAAARRAEHDKPQLDAWKNRLNDADQCDNDLADIGQGQTHRQNLSRNVKIQKANLRQRGLEPDAENADDDLILQYSIRDTRLVAGRDNVHTGIQSSGRSQPLDPAVERDRPYTYKNRPRRNRRGHSKDSSPAFKDGRQSQISLRTKVYRNDNDRAAFVGRRPQLTNHRDLFPVERLVTDASRFTSTVTSFQKSRVAAIAVDTNHGHGAFCNNREPLQTVEGANGDGASSVVLDKRSNSNPSMQMPRSDSPVMTVQQVSNQEPPSPSEGDKPRATTNDTDASSQSDLLQSVDRSQLAALNVSNPALDSSEAFWNLMNQIRSGNKSSAQNVMASNISPCLPLGLGSQATLNTPSSTTQNQGVLDNTSLASTLDGDFKLGVTSDKMAECDTKATLFTENVSALTGDTEPSMLVDLTRSPNPFTRHPNGVENLKTSVAIASPAQIFYTAKVDQKAEHTHKSHSSNIEQFGYRQIDDEFIELHGSIYKLQKSSLPISEKVTPDKVKAPMPPKASSNSSKNHPERQATGLTEAKATTTVIAPSEATTVTAPGGTNTVTVPSGTAHVKDAHSLNHSILVSKRPENTSFGRTGGLGASIYADPDYSSTVLQEKSTDIQTNQVNGLNSKKALQHNSNIESVLYKIDQTDVQADNTTTAPYEQKHHTTTETVDKLIKEGLVECQHDREDVKNGIVAQTRAKALEIDLNQVQIIPEAEGRRAGSFVISTDTEDVQVTNVCQRDPMDELSVRLSKWKIIEGPRKK